MRKLLLQLLLLCASVHAQNVGDVFPAWTEGTLDIHQINTGKGNSALLILPDGTSLLIDAGWLGDERGRSGARGTPQKPDSTRNPGEWIARYARHMLAPTAAEPALDYAVLTHFHDDHMGGPSVRAKKAKGGYQLTGITEVGEFIPIRTMLDRAWPDYNFPAPLTSPMMDNYRAFLKWQSEHNGMKVERFRAGRKDQIVLKRAPSRYPEFEIRNVTSNAEIWTGVASNTRQQYPLTELRDENICSNGLRLSYGKFDYGSFGDIPGIVQEGAPIWGDIETPVARAVGPLEVVVLDHHGNRNSTNAFWLSSLRPQVFVIPVWSSDHPGHDVLDRIYSTRIYPGPRDVFATNMTQANKDVIGPLLDRLKSSQGHIVVRVDKGGATFRVFILDDSTESFKITAVHGPYQSN